MTDTIDPRLRAVVARCAPFWAGEAEVIRTYWDAPLRNRTTDLGWIARQCHKELFDGVVSRLGRLHADLGTLDTTWARRDALDVVSELHDELRHYVLFAELYDTLRAPADPPLTYATVHTTWRWAENDALMTTRATHRGEHGALGAQVEAFTEGGLGTLFTEARRLRGRGGIDAQIAAACERVHADEVGHMHRGLVGLPVVARTPAEWDLLGDLACAQLRLRIRMRAAQFGHPVSGERLRALESGAGDPATIELPSLP